MLFITKYLSHTACLFCTTLLSLNVAELLSVISNVRRAAAHVVVPDLSDENVRVCLKL